MRQLLFFTILLTATVSIAQTGPAGVGDTSSVEVWLRASDITVGNGNEITTWPDTSGNNNDFTAIAGNGGTNPTWDSLGINDRPGVLFPGDAARFEDDDGESYINGMDEFTIITLIQSDELSTTDVGIFDSEDPDGADDQLTWRYDDAGFFGGGSDVIKFGIQTTGGNVQYESVDNTHTINPQLLIGTWADLDDTARLYLNGAIDAPSYRTNQGGTLTGSTKAVIGRGPKDDGTSGWDGYVVEFALLSFSVNEVQRILIENYLAAKYLLTVTNDIYAFQSTFGEDVAGVGQVGADLDTIAYSAYDLGIGTTDANLDSGDFILFGHNGGDATTWATAEQPLADTNFLRLEREWRFDITGTPGMVTLAIDTAGLPAKTTDYEYYYLWTDVDGDFSSGATAYLLTKNDSVYEASNVTLADGLFATISIYRPVINFTSTSLNGKESVTPATFEIGIPYEVYSTITVDFDTLAASTSEDVPNESFFTLTANSLTATFNVTITSDGTDESDETIIFDLNGSTLVGAVLGSDSVSTYTVNDDDEGRNIEFLTPCAFGYKQTITIDNTKVGGSVNITDYPLLVTFTDDSLRTVGNGGHVENSNGFDIRFTYKDSLEWLDMQIEGYDATTGEYYAWVILPTLDFNEDTELDMYYGNSSVTVDPSDNTIWTNYNGIWHFDGDLLDDSDNGYDSLLTNGTPDFSSSDSLVGAVVNLDGTNEYFDIGVGVLPTTGDFTISFWMNADTVGIGQVVFDIYGTPDAKYLFFDFNNAQQRWWFEDAVDDDMQLTYATAPTADTWHYVTIIGEWFSSDHALYIDGQSRDQTINLFDGFFTPTSDIRIGYQNVDYINEDGYFNGQLDELRISANEISLGQHATEYNNVNSPSTFYTFSTEEVNACSASEGIAVISVVIGVDSVVNAITTVDYAITGGTATKDSDYTITEGTATIPANDSTVAITINITDDLVDELSETITVSLSNPSSNVNIGSVSTFTYTIEDNDNVPVLSFLDTTSTTTEGSGSFNVPVTLTAASGRDVTVDYAVSGGTASSGSDFVLANGTLTIATGELNENIVVSIIDDVDLESPETIIIDLSSPSGATLGLDTLHTLTLNDNDNLGFDGPGGVGDASGDGVLKMWIIADSATIDMSNQIDTILNEVGISELDLIQGTNAADYNTNAINGHSEMSFSDEDDALIAKSTLSASYFPFNEATTFIVTRTDDISQASSAYTVGTSSTGNQGTNLFSATIPKNGDVNYYIGDTTSGTDAIVNFSYDVGWSGLYNIFTYIASSGDGKEVWRNNTSVAGPVSNTSSFTGHTGFNFYLGHSTSDNFQGDIAEFILFNSPINIAQRIIINNYLGAKYGLTISNDIYDWQAVHDTEVAGIGRYDATNQHVAAKAGTITISNANNLDDGEYVLFGHDNAAVSSWDASDIPEEDSIRRLSREWRFDLTGTPGTITIGIDTTLLPTKPAGYEDYVIFLDDDGDFTSGAEVYATSLIDGEYKASLVPISSGDYVAIGIIIRSVGFSVTSVTELETASSILNINLNFASEEDITVDYSITGGTATQGVDYSLVSSGTITLLAGQTIATLDPGIINESSAEGDETILFQLSNPSTGTLIGSKDTLTYTITDDDNTRIIEFLSLCEFGYKRLVTINNAQVSGSTDFTDFPVLISITNDTLKSVGNGGLVENINGYDVFFTLKDSLTYLSHELEKYDPTTGQYVAWVKIPTLSATQDTEIDMYFGNGSIDTDYSSTDVWSAFNVVLHLNDTLIDQSGNGFDATNNETTNTTGKIGDGRDFDGANDFFELANAIIPQGTNDAFTISFWFNPDVIDGNDEQILDLGSPSGDHYFVFDISNADTRWGYESANDADAQCFTGAALPSTGTWYYVTLTGGWNDNDHKFYRDGAQVASSATLVDGPFTMLNPMRVGKCYSEYSSGFIDCNDYNGQLDEFRVYDGRLTLDWHITEYNNQNAPGTFITVGTLDTLAGCQLAESADSVTLTVAINPTDNISETSVVYSISGGLATNGDDYTLTSDTIKISAGENSAIFSFPLINDLTDEVDETIILSLNNPSTNAKAGTNSSLTYSILDDDDGPNISFVDTVTTVNEGTSLIGLTVQIDLESGNNVSIDYAVTGGTAISGTDYVALSGTLTIDAGDLTNTISLQPVDDDSIEVGETIIIELSNATNGTLGADSVITVTINDNDDLGFEGPGGVGDVTNTDGEGLLKLWLIADSAAYNASNGVSSWVNEVANINVDYTMIPASAADSPVYVSGAINGHAEISFGNVTDALVSTDALSASSFPSNELSIFIVTQNDNLSQQSYAYATDDSEAGTVDANSVSGRIPSDDSVTFDLSGSSVTELFEVGWTGTHNIFTHLVSSDTLFIYRNNDTINTSDPGANTFTGQTGYNLYLGKSGASDPFQGDIAEFIIFSSALNLAQVNIINNYLAAKYNLSITNDIYNFEVTHGTEVAGIGRVDSANEHVAARAGIITLSNASTLGDGDYVLFGHDNGSVGSWTTTDAPSGGFSRLTREWRFDPTGTPGTVTIAFDTTLLPTRPNGDEDYVVMVDADGVFSSGATTLNTTLVDGQYKASDVTISSGDYVTIGIVSRTIAFTQTSSNGFENVAKNVGITLSLVSNENITLDYQVTGGTATGLNTDYSLDSTGTVTVLAGQTTTNIPLGIINDSDLESDETIEITLRNAPSGITLGADSVHTYTINDDDNFRNVQFIMDSATYNESVDTIYLIVELDSVDATNTTKVYLSVTGGTAETTPAPDFTFTADTITILPTTTRDTLLAFVLNDVLDENNETIIFELSSPSNAGLGDTTTLVYTITDNDPDVVASFQDTTLTIDEGGSVASLIVELDNTAGKDITVNYAVNTGASTATGGGTDYTLADGSLVIDAGDQFGTINIALTDDDNEEVAETITVSISGANVTTDNSDTAVVTISDNDAFSGYYGPGGVGNNETNLLWLDATFVNGRGVADPSELSALSTWTDNSGNGYVFTATSATPSEQPIWDSDLFNGAHPAVAISNSQYGFEAPNGFSNTLSNYTMITVARQYSGDYYIETNTAGNGNFRLNLATNGLYTFNGTNYLTGNTTTLARLTTWMFNVQEDSSSVVYRSGSSLASDNNFSVMSLENNFSIGNRYDGASQAVTDFRGRIAEFIIYNSPLNEAQRIIVENYLASKYDLTIANDLYDYQGIFKNDIAGIGSAGVNDQHLEAMSDSMLLISSPSNLDSGEFVFIGHDNGDVTSWTTFEAPLSGNNIRRLAREWRIDTVGNPGTVVMKVDDDALPTPIAGYSQYVLWTDADGDFNSGATLYQLSESAGLYVSTDVTIDAGTYVALGIIKPVIEFTLTSSDSTESYANPKVEVNLNFTRNENVTVDYQASGGTATGGNIDYLLANGTLTIPAGQQTKDIDLGVIDDAILEGSETVEISLGNPSANVSLGSSVLHTYTILDNEADSEIKFFYSDSTDSEATALVSPVILLTDTAQTDSIQSDGTIYAIFTIQPGSTAIYDTDYDTSGVFSTDTLFIPNGDSVATFDINITNDALFESSETIIVRITGSNVNIGTNNEFTLTITDNDTQPVVQFTDTLAFGQESVSPVQLDVALSTAGGADVDVDYTVTASTATNGVDFNLSNGTLTIDAGDTEGAILLTIFNDGTTESAETIEITLSSPINATLGSDSIVFTYTILDDDDLGDIGPGGVGDSTTNLLWLRADNFDLTTWADTSGNDYDAIEIGTVTAGTAINSKATVVLDGSSNGFDIDALTSSSSDYDVFSVYDANAGTDFTLYESDGSGDTLALMHDGASGAFYDVGDTWIGTAISSTAANILEYKLQSGSGNAAIRRDGADLETTLTYNQTALSGQKTIGLSSTSDNYFDGDLAEVIFYNTVLNSAQRKLVENYLSHRYNITVTNDLHTETGGYTEDLAGLGRDSSAALQTSGVSQRTIKLSNANSLDDGDFLVFAHDDGSIASWTGTDAPSGAERLTREWRVSVTGSPGSVTFTIDTTIFPARSATYETFGLLVDGDGSFANTDTIYTLTSIGGSEYEANGISFSDGDYFTIAALSNETSVVGPADFSDPATWVSGRVPGAGEGVTITAGDTIFLSGNTTIGSVLDIGNGGVLDLNGFTLTLDVGCITLSGTGTVDVSNTSSRIEYASNGDQCVTGMTYANLDLETTGNKFLLGNIDINGDLDITDAGVSFDITVSNYQINLAGNWTSVGTFLEREGVVVFDGTTAQTVNTSGGETFNVMEINKATNDLNFGSSISISDTIKLTLGDAVLGINDLELADTAIINGGGITSYLQANSSGLLRQYLTATGDSLIYPVGDNDDYSPFTFKLVTGTLGGSAAITLNLRDIKHPSVTESSYITRYWSLNQENISGTIDYNVAYQYIQGDVVGAESQLLARKFSGSGDALGGEVSVGANTLSYSGHSSFSDHTGENMEIPLPITLYSIEARLENYQALIRWTTATEINNDYFIVQRSIDGIEYEDLGVVDGNGDSERLIDYMYVDKLPYYGLNYYRLKQVDFDGQWSLTPVVSVNNLTLGRNLKFILFPNPASRANINLRIVGLEVDEDLIARVVDNAGRTIITMDLDRGNDDYKIPMDQFQSSGLYYVIIEKSGQVKQLKLLITD